MFVSEVLTMYMNLAAKDGEFNPSEFETFYLEVLQSLQEIFSHMRDNGIQDIVTKEMSIMVKNDEL